MPDYISTWRNLLSIASILQESGLVTEFNGVLREIDGITFEITANRRDVEGGGEAPAYYLDAEQNGFYRRSEFARIDRTRNYSLKLLDGALIQYFCVFRDDCIARQRLSFYQSPLTVPYDFEYREYDDWIASSTDADEESRALFTYGPFEYRDAVSFRLEFAPEQYCSVTHPSTHLHLNSFEGCRIPVSGPVGVATFFRFVLKNFYSEAWNRVSTSIGDQVEVRFDETIDGAERRHVHVLAA